MSRTRRFRGWGSECPKALIVEPTLRPRDACGGPMPFSIDFYHFSYSGAIFWGRRCARLREQDRPISLMAYTTLRVVKPPFLGGHGSRAATGRRMAARPSSVSWRQACSPVPDLRSSWRYDQCGSSATLGCPLRELRQPGKTSALMALGDKGRCEPPGWEPYPALCSGEGAPSCVAQQSTL